MNRTLLLFSLCLCVSVVSLFGCDAHRDANPKREIRIAAAADLKFALDDIVAEFQKANPLVEVKTTYGSSGNFFAQLSNHAPFDLFLSADVSYPEKLVEEKLAAKDMTFQYAVGILVVWVPNSSKLDLDKRGMEALLDPTLKKIAIANPRHAPYGRAAETALKKLGVYEAIAEKLALGENVMQAAQFIESGAADAGLIPLSLAMAPAMRDKGRWWKVPQDVYPRLDQGGVILSCSQDREAALAFRVFLTGDQGKAVLRRYGFIVPGD